MPLTHPSTSLRDRILRRLTRQAPGHVFVPRDLLDLGGRGAVDVALQRLAQAGHIRRLGRGVYDLPRVHPRLGALTPPAEDVARALARTTGERIVLSGAAAANRLGLSTQVPARPVFLTSGTSRDVRAGSLVIRLRHAADRTRLGGDTPAGLAVRALRFLGKDGLDDDVLARLLSVLTPRDQAELAALSIDAPAWMRPTLSAVEAYRLAA